MSGSKRVLDVVTSLCGIVLCLPLLLIACLLIWIEDRGPILFRQDRLGRNGKVFVIYKFRKFSVAPDNLGPNVTLQDDHRYSKIGKLLEATKINELPQLINVLKGDMSFVGPRPELPEYGDCYYGTYRELLRFTPGIFGPSQTRFRNEALMYPKTCNPEHFYANVLFPQKADQDIQYYKTATIGSDLYWVYRSIAAVLTGLPLLKKTKNTTDNPDFGVKFEKSLSEPENLASSKKLHDPM